MEGEGFSSKSVSFAVLCSDVVRRWVGWGSSIMQFWFFPVDLKEYFLKQAHCASAASSKTRSIELVQTQRTSSDLWRCQLVIVHSQGRIYLRLTLHQNASCKLFHRLCINEHITFYNTTHTSTCLTPAIRILPGTQIKWNENIFTTWEDLRGMKPLYSSTYIHTHMQDLLHLSYP